MSDIIRKGAVFNHDRTRRYRLWRIWDLDIPKLTVIGTNPSIADENTDDPTIRQVEARARALGYGGITMINMMDVIETDSRKLDQMTFGERCSERNVDELEAAIVGAQNGYCDILCAWGKPGQKYGGVAWFATQCNRAGVTLFCLKKNKDGSPHHPLYIPYSKQFEWFAGVDFKDAASPMCTGVTA